jgi:hypothetical protein
MEHHSVLKRTFLSYSKDPWVDPQTDMGHGTEIFYDHPLSLQIN